MKKIVIAMMLAVTVSTGAFAIGPGHGFHGGGWGGRTTVIVGGGFYSPWYYPFGYWGYPYPYYAAPYHQPTKLDMQVMDIKNDYADKISSVKLDKSLSRKERRQQIRAFKRERDRAVMEARRNYYKQPQQPQQQ